jgi:HemY protein
LFRAIWFLIQVGLVVAAAVWISQRPGFVVVEWMDYRLSAQIGIFLLMIAVVVIAALVISKIVGAITSIPRHLAERHEENARRRGYRALTRGFVAIAAGDAKHATKLAKQTRGLLPDDNGLPVLLEAQAARLRGEEGAARHSFEELLKDKDASFFGIRGLLKSSLDAGDNVRALEYARKALAAHPKQGWILKTVYDLELKNRHWDDASKTLAKIERYHAMSAEQVCRDEIALLILQSQRAEREGSNYDMMRKLEKAHRLDPSFVPSTVLLAEKYIAKNKNRKATAIIEKAWKQNPHPDLLVLWNKLAPANKPSDQMRRLRWYEKLVAIKPDSAEGQMAAARAAMQDGLWGEAKAYLTIAEQIEPSAKLYKLRAYAEEQTTYDPKRVREWLEKAADAVPSKVWTCRETGAVYERWSPVAEPHGAFNSIVWSYPLASRKASLPIIDPMMIEAA